jgi:glutamyl-tRNA synthetase
MSEIRVRFAPSPTGYLHVGGLRTALYNYLFARHENGKMVLRIEDTDRTRYVEGAAENLMKTLRKCGVEYDEGPDKEGSFGPYVQSERQNFYTRHAEELLEKGHAYKCFCTRERLEEMRKRQLASGQATKYDGHCRHLSKEEIKEKEDSGLPYTIRLKVPESGTLSFTDQIRGKVEFELPLIEDQILIKSDGYPTYHLANVVDDHYMKISHVIRGEEWLPSTPKHILMYRAFGWEVPEFAHLPLLLNPDKSKLSKRQGDVAVEDYLGKGYLPESLVNFVALLGWNPGSNREIFSLKELTKDFSLNRINKAGAVFDIAKLNWMNGQYLRGLDDDKYVEFVKPFVSEILQNRYAGKQDKIALALKNNIDFAAQVKDHLDVFLHDEVKMENAEALEMVNNESSKTVFRTFLSLLDEIETLDAGTFKQTMKAIQKETGVKGKNLFMPVRVALTGQMHGPDLAMTAEIFGKEKVKERLKKML